MRRWLSVVAATLATAPAWSHQNGVPPGPARQSNDVTQGKNAYLIGYSHLDTQWRWTYLDTIGEYIPKTLHDNFALFEKYPDYTFNFTGSRRYRMMREYYPADYQRLKEYIRTGRWYPTGSSVEENDVNVPSAESHIRNTLYGNHYFWTEFGIRPVDFILPDCFGFPASIPSILAHLGAKGFSTQKLTWGSAAGIPFTVGVWEGLDGRSVVAALDPGSYTSNITEDLSQSRMLLDRINKVGDRSGAYVDYRYFGAGDTGGSPTESSVQWVERSKTGTGPVNVIGGPADQMFLDLKPEHIAKMERYKGDLELTEHSAGSITSQVYMKRWNRKNELLADNAERASVAAMWLGGTPYPQARLTRAWELVLGSQMHDILPGTSVPKAYEYSWNDEVVALNQYAAVLQTAAGSLTRNMDTRAQGVALAVYNPLSIAREDVVDATVRLPRAAKYVRVYGPDGRETPAQVVSATGATAHILFLARVPSVGMAVYDVRPAAQPGPAATGLRVSQSALENNRYRVTLNAAGDVAQIYDKTARRNLLSGPARLAFKFEEPAAWPAWNIDWKDQSRPPVAYVTGPATVRVVENGPARVALEITRSSMGSKFTQRIRLGAQGAGNRVEFDTRFLWNTRKHTLKTEFPLAVRNQNATYNLGMGAIERSTNDPKKYEVVSHQWFDLTDTKGDYGVSVLEDSRFGSDKPDDHTLRLTLVRTPSARSYPDQSTQDLGQHEVVYALSGHAGDWRRGQTPWEAARLNQPLVAFQTPAHTGRFGKSFSLFTVSTPSVAIAAIKKAEDSNEIIVRLQELTGRPVRGVRLSAATAITRAREVNGQELPIGPARLTNGVLTTDLTGYLPRTFALTVAAPAQRQPAPIARPLTIPFDTVAATNDGEATTAGFDGQGYAFAADLMPASVTSDNIPFRLAPGGGGRKSAMAARGQKLALPGGGYTKIYVLATAVGGDQRGNFMVDNRAVPVKVQDWNAFVGQWDNRVWMRENAMGAPRQEGGIYGLRPAYIKRDPIAWFGEHRHKADGGNDIYAYTYIYKYRINVPSTAKTLTFPQNPNIRVFAVTAAHNPADEITPVHPLYDTFREPDNTPLMSPAPGNFNNTVELSVHPGLYITSAKLHYTTDGSTPTAQSPVYQSAIMVSRPTQVKVRAIRPDGTGGAVVTTRYNVNDVTPPTVRGVVALEGSPMVRINFSEPLNRASAEAIANYTLSPTLSVQSARLREGGRSVELMVAPAPTAGQAYTLTMNGLKDMAPNGNPVSGGATSFAVSAPAFQFAVDQNGALAGGATPENIRIVGEPTATSSPTGNALLLNGNNQRVVVQNNDALNPTDAITVTAWIQPSDWTGGNRRIVQKGLDDNQFRLYSEEGRLVFEIAGVGLTTGDLPAVNRWSHVAATYDGASMRLYVDGNLVGVTEVSGSIPTSSDSLVIGGKGGGRPTAGDHFRGAIGEVRVYNQALLPEHLKAMAASNTQR